MPVDLPTLCAQLTPDVLVPTIVYPDGSVGVQLNSVRLSCVDPDCPDWSCAGGPWSKHWHKVPGYVVEDSQAHHDEQMQAVLRGD